MNYRIQKVNGTFVERYNAMPCNPCCVVPCTEEKKERLIRQWQRLRQRRKDRTLEANRRAFVDEMQKIDPTLRSVPKKDLLKWAKDKVCQ